MCSNCCNALIWGGGTTTAPPNRAESGEQNQPPAEYTKKLKIFVYFAKFSEPIENCIYI